MDTNPHEAEPSPEILRAFQCEGSLERLAGGEGRSFKIGKHVLKPVDDVAQHEWSCSIISQLDSPAFRTSKPIRSQSGTYVHKGWSASRYEPGSHLKGNWRQKIEVGLEFHAQINRLPWSGLPQSNDWWTHAHDIVWGRRQLPINLHPQIKQHVLDLLGCLRDIPYTDALIHADLCGNILFSENSPPLVIDFSPAIAPIEYAQAIIVADAIPWEGAPLKLIEELPQTITRNQMLLRAICFRVIVKALSKPTDIDQFRQEYSAFEPMINLATKDRQI